MKFSCDRCKTRYSIADEKVRGKILKIRCKSCEAVITVRDSGAGAEGPRLTAGPAAAGAASQPVVSTAGGKGRARPAAKTIELAALSSTGSLTAQPDPGPTTPPPRAEPAPQDEWYLSVDGAQEGPFSPEEAQRRVAAKAPGIEMFAWRDDFTDWLPVEEVPILAVHVRRLPPPPPRRNSGPVGIGTGSSAVVGAPAPARAASGGGVRVSSQMPALALSPNGFPALASSAPALAPPPVRTPMASPEPESDPAYDRGFLRGDATEIDDPFETAGRSRDPEPTPPPAENFNFDLPIGEASRVVKLPILPPSGSNPPSGSAAAPPKAEGLPGVGFAAGAGASRPTAAARRDESLQLPIIDASQGNLATISAVAGSASPSRRRRLVVPLALGGFAVLAVLGGVILLSRGGEDRARSPGDEIADQVLVNDFYRKDNPLAGHEPAHVEAPAAPPTAEKTAGGKTPAKAVGSLTPPRPVPGRPGTVGGAEPARIGPATTRPNGKVDTFDDEAGPADPLTPDDVRNTYAANEVGLKRCYERSLKADPSSSVTKMVVKITISPHGGITDIVVPDKSDLAGCVTSSIKTWRFRRSNGEFTTEFTVFFAKRG